MGNCLGSEEAEVESVKNLGHHGHPQAIARPDPMAAPKADASMSSGHPSRSPSSSMNSSTTARSSSTSSSSRPLATADAGAYPEGRILEVPNLRIFTFAELKAATRNFKPDTILGEGGFGRVYKGWVDEKTMSPVRCGTGMVVAVKKLNPESVQGLQEWQSEVNFLGRLSHPNLVRLLGYCLEHKELLLVYEFMAKGSLENHLFRTLQRQALGFRPREEWPDRWRQPHHHQGDGHLRLRRAGVRCHRALVREERRVRLRRRAAGDAHGAAGARHGPPRAAAQPGGLGQAVPGGPAEAGAPDRPAAGGAVPVQGRGAGGPAHAALPLGRPQEPALHGRGRGCARGGRADQGASQGRAAGRHVAAGRRSSAGWARAPPLVAPEVRVGRGAEQPPPVSNYEVAPLVHNRTSRPALIELSRKFGRSFPIVLGFSRQVQRRFRRFCHKLLSFVQHEDRGSQKDAV
ncbi:uncharacterized protein LOC133889022 isoform X1 [Phragmites australis]|uniref:uncharacterized protein LOC133889022 isoform X1 n=1 Tax=Phragmites australis TaxID=29695 RepID=UPI002D7710A7|nr:uncharacterized protein LOC133889022 isoform X1 [Phragmites australis]